MNMGSRTQGLWKSPTDESLACLDDQSRLTPLMTPSTLMNLTCIYSRITMQTTDLTNDTSHKMSPVPTLPFQQRYQIEPHRVQRGE